MRTTTNKKLVGATVASALILLGGLGGCGKTETSETLVAQARQFIEKGENKAAIIQLKNALVKNPSDVEARTTLATLYNETEDPLSAEKEARKAMSLGASPAQTVPILADALLAQREFQKVLDETADDSVKASAAVLTMRGDAQLAMRHADQAKASYDLALKTEPAYPRALIGLARLALLDNDVDGANRLVEQAVAGSPKNAAAWLFRGELLRAQGKRDEALIAYETVLKIAPDHRSAHIEKAYTLIAQRKFAEAQLEVAQARKATPGSGMVAYTQAVLDFSQGKHAAAKESLQMVLKASPRHMPSILLSGAVELALGSMPQAEQYLKNYLKQYPNDRYARKLMVMTLLKLGRAQEASATMAPMLAQINDDSQMLALAGETYMQAHNYAKAAEYFEKAIALAPKMATLRTALAMSKLAQGDHASAVAELELSAQLDAKSPKAGTLLVLTELRRRNYDKALAAVKVLEANQPDDPSVYNLKGGVYLAKTDNANARVAFEKAISLKPDYFPAMGNLVQLSVKENKPDVAKKLLLAYLEKNKKSDQALQGLAALADAYGHRDEATQWLEQANRANPDAIPPAIALISYYLRHGQREKALTLVRRYQVANPTVPELADMLGQAQLASGDANGALEAFSKLTGLAPKSAHAHYRLATAHLALKNPVAAANDLKKALALQPDLLSAQLAQAELLAGKGQYDAAHAIARQIQKQRPQDPMGFVLEGDLLKNQGKVALALRPYEQAVAMGKSSSNLIKLHRAMVAAGKGKEADLRLAQWQKERAADLPLMMYSGETLLASQQYRAAIDKLEAALKLSPNNVAVLNNLAWGYQQTKDPRALKTAEQAYQLASANPAVMDTLGWVLVEQGNPQRGVPILQKAVGLAPDAADLRYHLAVGLHKMGDTVGARKVLEQLVAAGKPFNDLENARLLLKQM